jgi:hypothetical protein
MSGMRYVRPRSLTWWAGTFLIAMGVVQAAGVPSGGEGTLGAVLGVLHALAGGVATIGGAGASPAALIGLGLGMIGVRDAMIRNEDAAEERLGVTLQAMAPATDYDMDGVDADDVFGFDADPTPQGEVYPVPDGESPLPPGVRDPYGPGGSRE